MMTSRRDFALTVGKLSLIPALLSITTACPFSNVYQNLLHYVPVALSAFSAILAIVAGGGITVNPEIQVVITTIKTALSDLQAAIDQYLRAPTGQKATWLGKISEALTVAEANLQKFWSDLSIPDARLATLIEGLLGVIISTLQGFQSQVPTATTAAAAQARALKASVRGIAVTPKVRSLTEFRNEFNSLLVNGGEGQHSI